MAPAMPCKIMKKNCGSGGSNKVKTKLACILEADESTTLRIGESLPHHHEDHIAGKGETSLQHYNLVHKFIPMLHAMKIAAANLKSTSPTMKNGYENCIYSMNNINTSDEDKHETNYINKYNDANTDTRKLHK